MSGPTRRDVVKALSAAGASLCVVTLGGCPSGPSGIIAAGSLDDLVDGELTAIAGEGIAIGLDDGGLFAVSTICTHLSCDMSTNGTVAGTGMVCDCHGSEFDITGTPRVGPATEPLEFYAVSVDAEGAISIDADTVVSATTRLEV